MIETAEATLLFGAGHGPTVESVPEIAREHGIDAAIAEHRAWDHYGGGPWLREELGVELAVPAGDAEDIRTHGDEPDHLLEGGERFRGVGVIDATGHTPGPLVFLYEDVLVAGDTVLGSDTELIADDDWRAHSPSPGRTGTPAATRGRRRASSDSSRTTSTESCCRVRLTRRSI